MKKFAVPLAMLAMLVLGVATHAVQFDYLDPGYNQQIYTGPLVGGPGMAWTSAGNLLTRNQSDILEYSLTQNPPIHQGTSVHNTILTHTISGLSTSGYGMTRGLDGYIYTPTNGGLQRFNPSNWAAPAQNMSGTVYSQGYGITTLPDGRIVYVGGPSTNEVYVYDPANPPAIPTPIFTAPGLIDDIEASPSGEIALAGQVNSDITIITASGGLVNSFSTAHFPDGSAFGDGAASASLFANNNDGTITEYALGPGFTGIPTVTDIATQTANGKAYGDLAAVGPDCAFYVFQGENGGYHGCTPGVGTHWDNGVTNAEASIIRIAAVQRNPDGTETEICGFHSPVENIPEPGSLLALGTGLLALGGLLRRRK